MSKVKSFVIALCVLTGGFTVFGQGCKGPGGTTTGNPMVSVEFAPYDANSKTTRNINPQAAAASVHSLTMCFKRLRFKSDNITEGEDNVDLLLGEVTLNPEGTPLADVDIPSGTYDRIEFDLDSSCASGKSLQVTNGNGIFSTGDRMTLRFEGQVTIDENSDVLELFVQQIVSALGGVSANSQIRSAAESVSGSF